MEGHKQRLILRTIVAVSLFAAAIGIVGALTPQQGAMQPTPTVTSSLGAIPPYADRPTATPPIMRAATGPPPAPKVTIVMHSDATDRAATPVAPAPCTPMPALTTEAGRLASLTATAYPGQNNPGSYATEHPPTPVPTATLASCP